jgi:hypothetical protein
MTTVIYRLHYVEPNGRVSHINFDTRIRAERLLMKWLDNGDVREGWIQVIAE